MHIDEQTKIKRGIKLVMIIGIITVAVPFMAYGTTQEHIGSANERSFVSGVSDKALTEIERVQIHQEALENAQRLAAEAVERANTAKAEREATEAEAEWYRYEDYGYVETPYTPDYSSYGDGSGLTQSGGVNYHDGRRETYYSSNVLYHYRTPEWTLDDEGFWRTDDGYYVVAASDMAQGTVFEGSKGECIVLDSGCAAGTTDYYVNWG